jgi:large subunit ribosomal protein L19
MSKAAVIQRLENKHLKKKVPDFRVGDIVKVHTRIIEGEKERVQVFMGTVIARTGGGLSETFSIHRVAYGEGMERVFPLHSPRIAKIEVVRQGSVRRAKLYYLRGTSGKAAKVKARATLRRPYKDKEEVEPVEEVVEEVAVVEESAVETNETNKATE